MKKYNLTIRPKKRLFKDGAGLAKMNDASKTAFENASDSENLGSTISGLFGGLGSIATSAMSNAAVDTTTADNAIDAVESFQPNKSSLDALAESYRNINFANTSYDAKDFGVSTGQGLANMGSAILSGAATGASIGGPWGAVGGAAVGLLTSGAGWIAGANKAKREARRLEGESIIANTSATKKAMAAKDDLMEDTYMDYMIKAADGGKLNIANTYKTGGAMHSHGGIFSNGIVSIGNGGTHEQNPYEGVQFGIDSEGIPNMVEEGEVIWQDYVFSNRLKPTKEFKDTYKIKGETFADAANEMQKESEERFNDSISKRGLNDSMMKLMLEQEKVRSTSKRNTSNNMFDKGGKKTNKSKSDTLDTSSMVNSVLEHDYYVNQLGYRTVEEGKRLERDFKTQKVIEDITGGSDPLTLEDIFSVFRKDKKYKTGRNKNNKFNSGGGLNVPFMHNGKTITNEEFLKLVNSGKAQVDYKYFTNPKAPSLREAVGKTTIAPLPKVSVTNNLKKALDLETKRALTPPVSTIKTLSYDTNITDTPASRNSWLRYAPVLGSSLGVLLDAFGVTNKPDYTNANIIRDSYNVTPIGYNPLNDYISYRPFDVNYYSNKLAQQSAATKSAIQNQVINSGAAIAGLLASDYNAQTQLGGLFRQAEEYNQAQKERVSGFNRQTNAMNSEMDMKASLANQKAEELRLKSALAQAQLREHNDATASASRSANLTNLFDNLGAVGKEQTMINMLNDNPYLLYTVLDSTYKNTPKRASGGKINRKRRK